MVFSRASSYGRGCGRNNGTHIPKQDYHECQLLPCRHPAITDTPIIWTAVKSQELLNYRYLTEINSHCYGLSLMRTQTQGPYIKGVDCKSLPHQSPFVSSRTCVTQRSSQIIKCFTPGLPIWKITCGFLLSSWYRNTIFFYLPARAKAFWQLKVHEPSGKKYHLIFVYTLNFCICTRCKTTIHWLITVQNNTLNYYEIWKGITTPSSDDTLVIFLHINLHEPRLTFKTWSIDWSKIAPGLRSQDLMGDDKRRG